LGKFQIFLVSNKVENLFVVFVMADVTANELGVSYHAFYVWPALNQKFPLASYLVHLFLLGNSAYLPKIWPRIFPFSSFLSLCQFHHLQKLFLGEYPFLRPNSL
jgi:hypothetical protein